MSNLKNIYRCYALGMGIKGISSTFGLSRNTVRKYVRMYQESGLSLDRLMKMSEEHLEEMFVGSRSRVRVNSPRPREAQVDMEAQGSKSLKRSFFCSK